MLIKNGSAANISPIPSKRLIANIGTAPMRMITSTLSCMLRLSQGLLRGDLELEEVIQLFADGADPNADEANFGGAEPTMILAARYPDIKIIQFLLKSGSSPNVQNKEGKNSLRLILENYEISHTVRKQAIDLFRRYGIDPLPRLSSWDRVRLYFKMHLL